MSSPSALTSRFRDRVSAWFVLVLMAAGCLALWIALPLGAMWVAGELTDSFGLHMPLAMVLAVTAMLAVGAGLGWLNELYLRITFRGSEDDEVRRSGPLEPMLIASLTLAALAFVAWFLLLAENPALTP